MDVNNLQQEQDQGCNDATLSCMICTGDNPVEDTFQSPCEQRCPYCRDCLQRHYTLSFKEEGLFPPKCCGQTIPIEAAIPFLTKEVLQTYSDKIIEYGTPHDKRMYCHVSTCSQFIPTSVPEHDGVKACPSCKEKTCTLCNKAEHPGEEWCPNDDASSERLAELAKAKEWQTCPKCRAVVELVVGCNHIVCTCGAEFCYVCASPWPTCECEMFREPDEDEEDEDFGYYDPPGPFQGRNREEFWGINIANGELRGGVREWYRVGHEAGRYRRHFTTLYPEPAQARQQYHQTLGEQHEAADQDLYGHHPGPSYRDETRPVPEEVVPFNRAIDPSRALRGRGSMYYPVPAWSLRPSQEELAEERLAYRHYRLAVPDVPTVVHRPIATDEQSPEPQQQEDNDSEVGGLQLPQHLLHRLQQQQQEDNDSEVGGLQLPQHLLHRLQQQQQEDNDSEVGGLQLPQHLLHRLQQQQHQNQDGDQSQNNTLHIARADSSEKAQGQGQGQGQQQAPETSKRGCAHVLRWRRPGWPRTCLGCDKRFARSQLACAECRAVLCSQCWWAAGAD